VGHMLGCSDAQINLSVQSAIWLPANVCLERIPELQSKTWELVSRRQKRPEGIRGSRRAPPYGAEQHGRRSSRAVSRHTAMKKGKT
jgi:hypothetical protein